MAQLNFDATGVAPSAPFEALPAGEYPMAIVASEMKPTRAGDGHYLSLTLEVLSGECKGRKVFDNLNLHNPNPTATAIAQATLSAICHATGVMRVNTSEELHNRPMLVKVTQKNDQQYGPGNQVKGYSAYAQQGAPVAAPTFAPAPQAAPVYAPPPQAAPAFAGAQPPTFQQPAPQAAPAAPWMQPAPQAAPVAQAPVAPAPAPAANMPPWAQA